MISTTLLALVRCPDCRAAFQGTPPELRCTGCGRVADTSGAYLDLRPRRAYAEQTRYVDEGLHADARHESVSPPLLSAGVRQSMLRAFLVLKPGDRLLDLGCGSGRVLIWNQQSGAYLAGVDVSPFFAREAIETVDLTLGDLRQLPFADGAFNKACALDVLEHLSREALADVLAEACRVLAPGGRLFVYSHVRQNAWLAGGLRAINRLARWLERRGLIDLTQERLRKSDHVNPLADIDDLTKVVRAAGFQSVRLRYYTPLVGGFIENVLVRLVEHALASRSRRRPEPATATESGRSEKPADGHDRTAALRAARTEAKRRIAARGVTYRVLQGLTWLMHLDVLLFGRIRSGPFFALLEKQP